MSYSHIFDPVRLHGQDGTAARLLPLSVDGLIAAASLVMLHEARNARAAGRALGSEVTCYVPGLNQHRRSRGTDRRHDGGGGAGPYRRYRPVGEPLEDGPVHGAG